MRVPCRAPAPASAPVSATTRSIAPAALTGMSWIFPWSVRPRVAASTRATSRPVRMALAREGDGLHARRELGPRGHVADGARRCRHVREHLRLGGLLERRHALAGEDHLLPVAAHGGDVLPEHLLRERP